MKKKKSQRLGRIHIALKNKYKGIFHSTLNPNFFPSFRKNGTETFEEKMDGEEEEKGKNATSKNNGQSFLLNESITINKNLHPTSTLLSKKLNAAIER